MKTRRLNSRKGTPLRRIDAIGFTLVELMVTVAVMAILLGIAVPSFNEVMLGSKLSSFASSLSGSALLARSEAIKRNAPVTLCVSSTGTACGTGSWEQGWIVISGATVLHSHGALPSGLKVIESAAVDQIVFRPTGVGATSATFTVCRATPSVGGQERVVTISATGRADIEKTTNGACS
jgi:type IV fimbrial biogenesis protein FimT